MRTDLDQVVPIWLVVFLCTAVSLSLEFLKLCTDLIFVVGDFDALTYDWPVDCLSSP